MDAVASEQALLTMIEGERERRCAALRAEAEAKARALLGAAHAAARTRVREALIAARERAEARVAAANARRQTRHRLARQHADHGFLAETIARLPAALAARWRDAASRRQWIAHALGQAAASLAAGSWRIEHAAGIEPEDRQALAATLPAGVVAQWQLDPALAAGLRICADGNRIDATPAGLMADREALAGAILAVRGCPP